MFRFSRRITQAPRFMAGVAKQLNNVLALHSKGLVIDSSDIIPEQQPDGRIRLRLNPEQGFRQDSTIAGPITSITGACCIGTDCSITTEADCAGTWQGAGSGCSPNPCSGGGGGTGACCVAGVCSIQTSSDCTDMSGTYRGDDTICDTGTCGRCCFFDTSIQCSEIYDEAECSGLGFWKEGGNCTDDPCEGACCSGQLCEITSEAACTELANFCTDGGYGVGRAYYNGEDCNPCLASFIGDCCFFHGDCESGWTSGDCIAAEGTPLGPGQACCPDC